MAWLSPELPLEGLDIRGFRGLLQLFHFEAVLQSALALGTGEGYIIDAMQMRTSSMAGRLRSTTG